MPDQDAVYRKYRIERTDGSSEPGEKHAHCNYFVLDLDHDEFALVALEAYANACEKQKPGLASDLRSVLRMRGNRLFTPGVKLGQLIDQRRNP